MENDLGLGREGIIGVVGEFEVGLVGGGEGVRVWVVELWFEVGEKVFVVEWGGVYVVV